MKTDILNFSFLRDSRFNGVELPNPPEPPNMDVRKMNADFTYEGGKASFKLNGRDYWVIDPLRFAGEPHLDVTQSDNRILMVLTNAFYPGTKIPADFSCEVKRGKSGSLMNLDLKLGGFTCQVELEPWLVRMEAAQSKVHLHTNVCKIGSGNKVTFSGNGTMVLFPNWELHINGKGIAKLQGNIGDIKSSFVNVSLIDTGSNSLLASSAERRTLVTFTRNETEHWNINTQFDFPKEWELSYPQQPFEKLQIEVDLDQEGKEQSVLLAQPAGNKNRWSVDFYEKLHSIPLRDVNYVLASDENDLQEALIGRFDSKPVWYGAEDFRILMGDGPNAQPFELVFWNGMLERAVIVPELKAISAPLTDLIVDVKWNGQSVAVLPEKPGIPLPEHIQIDGQVRLSPVSRSAIIQLPASLVLSLVRPIDMLALQFQFLNLQFQAGGGKSVHLQLIEPNKPAYLIVHFPPQHIAEQVFLDEKDVSMDQPALSRMAGPSRLVFSLPNIDNKEISYNFTSLMDWGQYELMVAEPLQPGEFQPIKSPSLENTAIEAPYRLFISPENDSSEWLHKQPPLTHKGVTELWHTRLSKKNHDGENQNDTIPTIRAIWSPDFPQAIREDWNWLHDLSLTSYQRREIVSRSADITNPNSIKAECLMLSSLGAWMKIRGNWNSSSQFSIVEWVHQASMGRDTYVRTVEEGYLSNLGHRAVLVTITERRFKNTLEGESIAYLHQESYVVPQEYEKTYEHGQMKYEGRQFPFRRVRVLNQATPVIDRNHDNENPKKAFWIQVNQNDHPFHIAMEDFEGQWVELTMPLAFISKTLNSDNIAKTLYNEGPDERRRHGMGGQKIAFAESSKPGDTTFETVHLSFGVEMKETIQNDQVWFYPTISQAKIRNAAIEQFAGSTDQEKGINITFNQNYLDAGFDKDRNKGEVLANLLNPGNLAFPKDKSGGIVTPNMGMTALSRALGPVGGKIEETQAMVDLKRIANDPNELIKKGQEKLAEMSEYNLKEFDQFKLDQLAKEKIQEEVKQQFPEWEKKEAEFKKRVEDEIKNLGGEPAKILDKAKQKVQEMINEKQKDMEQLKELGKEKIQEAIENEVKNKIDDLVNKMDYFKPEKFLGDGAKILGSIPLTEILEVFKDTEKNPNDKMPQLTTRVIYPKKVDGTEDTNALPVAVETKFLWTPNLKKYKEREEPEEGEEPGIFVAQKDASLTINSRLYTKLKESPEPTYEITGVLTNFDINLIGSEKFLIISFNELTFKVKNDQKPTVIPDIKGVQFVGVLDFVNTLAEKLKSLGKGFNIDVSPSGIRISTTLLIPNLEIGILAIQNMSLYSEMYLPLLSDEPARFRFAFCTRENPFMITVGIFGGGGFFGFALGLDGMELLEASLEFGGNLALNLGVASGGVHLMAGIYYKMEKKLSKTGTMDDVCELSGYVRCGGSLNVLGLISISAEFYLGLCYKSDIKKVWGQATLTVKVEVLLFSTSVDLTVEKKFKGSAGDPLISQTMDAAHWEEYCEAFA